MYRLNDKAVNRLQCAHDQGMTQDRERDIVDIVLDQEIVSYCNNNGCVSFDVDDLIIDE